MEGSSPASSVGPGTSGGGRGSAPGMGRVAGRSAPEISASVSAPSVPPSLAGSDAPGLAGRVVSPVPFDGTGGRGARPGREDIGWAIVLFGVLVHKAPRACGTVGLVINPILYGSLKYFAPNIAFLNRMAICFFVILAVLALMTLLKPMAQPVTLPINTSMDMRTDPRTKVFGVVVVLLTLTLYVIFW